MPFHVPAFGQAIDHSRYESHQQFHRLNRHLNTTGILLYGSAHVAFSLTNNMSIRSRSHLSLLSCSQFLLDSYCFGDVRSEAYVKCHILFGTCNLLRSNPCVKQSKSHLRLVFEMKGNRRYVRGNSKAKETVLVETNIDGQRSFT